MQRSDTDVERSAPLDADSSLNDGVYIFVCFRRCVCLDKRACFADLLVSALVDSEDLTPIIKAVYRFATFSCTRCLMFCDGVLLRRGLEKKFVVKLEEFQSKKAAEISDLCYSGYKSFVISVWV
jgi:hypothetical protein